MTRRVVAAHWALMGKHARDKGDYRILSGSSPGLADRVWAGVPSTPELGGTPGPGSLPWTTFTLTHGDEQTDHRPQIAVTAIDATDDRDAVGRLAARFRYVEVPFAELAQGGTGYAALYRAVPELSPHEAPRQLTMELTGPDDTTARALVDDGSFDRAAILAALMLDGDVLITLGEENVLPLSARLAEFDLVMALLPFGMRADTTLASWNDGTSETRFRLAFGKDAAPGHKDAAPGQAKVPCRGPVSPPSGKQAARYRQALYAARERSGVARLVEYLAGHQAPLGTGELLDRGAEQAMAVLASLRDPMLVVDAVRRGGASPDRVANALRFSADELDNASREELEAFLLGNADGAAEPGVYAVWSDRSAPLAARLALSARMARHSNLAQRFFSLAVNHGETDSFLATVAAGQTWEGEDVPPRTVAATLRSFTSLAGGDLPILRRAVLDRPGLARWLLRLALRQDPKSQAGLDWLDPSATDAPPWLRRYAVLMPPRQTPVPLPAGMATLEDDETSEDLVLLAWFVIRLGSFAQLAGEWWPVLCTLARTDQPGEQARRQCLADLADLTAMAANSDLPTAARLDTLRLYLRLDASHCPLAATAPPMKRYLGALWDLWSEPSVNVDVTTLTCRLLDSARRAADPLGKGFLELLRSTVTDGRVPLNEEVADAIATVVSTTEGLADQPGLPPDWWSSVERLRPGIRTPAARLRSAVRRDDADPIDVAVLCGRSATSGLAAEEVVEIMTPYLAGRTTAETVAMFGVLEAMLGLAAAGQDSSYDEFLSLLAPCFGITLEKSPSPFRRKRLRLGRQVPTDLPADRFAQVP